jgi:uncharacterized cupin superfamily protein
MTDARTPSLAAIAHATDLMSRELSPIPLRPGAAPGTDESIVTLYDDGTVHVGLWECAPGEFPTAKDGVTEAMQILSGSATLHGEDGTEVRVGAGDSVVTPDGWRGTWTVHETIRKVFTLWPTAPR